jgi:hypothetical protein
LTRRLISEFARIVEADCSRFILAVLPTGPQIYEDLRSEILVAAGDDASHFDPTYPETQLRTFCEADGIRCVTLLDQTRTAAENAPFAEGRFFFDDDRRHFNDAGNACAARIVHEFLVDGSEQDF